jgi:hypothetical protein
MFRVADSFPDFIENVFFGQRLVELGIFKRLREKEKIWEPFTQYRKKTAAKKTKPAAKKTKPAAKKTKTAAKKK